MPRYWQDMYRSRSTFDIVSSSRTLLRRLVDGTGYLVTRGPWRVPKRRARPFGILGGSDMSSSAGEHDKEKTIDFYFIAVFFFSPRRSFEFVPRPEDYDLPVATLRSSHVRLPDFRNYLRCVWIWTSPSRGHAHIDPLSHYLDLDESSGSSVERLLVPAGKRTMYVTASSLSFPGTSL